MCIDITAGRAKDCRDGVGGLEIAYVAQLGHKNTLTATAEGIIDVFTLSTGEQFYPVDLKRELSSFNLVTTGSSENGTVFEAQTANIILNKGDVATRNFLREIATNFLMVIVKDRLGIYWLLGESNGLEVETGDKMSGVAMGDRNGLDITMTGSESILARSVDSTLIATLIVAGV